MANKFALSLLLCSLAVGQYQTASFNQVNKVFNYEGSMPIKDDRTGELITAEPDSDLISPSEAQSGVDKEEMCWHLVTERPVVTFALQKRVLDELDADLTNAKVEAEMREAIDNITSRLRKTMDRALEYLKEEAMEQFFDSFFETSETIIQFGNLVRSPNLDENLFNIMVKALSRLGRNNSAMTQEFMEKCSFVQRSPKPRQLRDQVESS